MRNKYWMTLIGLIILSPLGLVAEGTAWGEWGVDELQSLLGFVPAGIGQATTWFSAPIPDYTLPGLGEGRTAAGIGYIFSAVVGAGMVYAAATVWLRLLGRTGGR